MATAAELQPALTRQFAALVARDRLSQAYVFTGPKGSGKFALAEWLAQRLFCTNLQDGAPCGVCAACRRVADGNNPDVLVVRPDGNSIKADAVRELKEEMGKHAMAGSQRVFIIEDADKMTNGAANSLLKFFEEPYPGMCIILLTTAKSKLLPTVLSRAQIIQLQAPSVATIAQALTDAGVAPALSGLLATLSKDVTAGVAAAADPEFQDRLDAVLHLLALVAKQDRLAFPAVQTTIMKVVNGRPEQQQVLAIMAAAYSEALSRSYGQPAAVLAQADALTVLSQLPPLQLADGLAAVLEASQLVTANVNFQAATEQLVLRLLGTPQVTAH